MMPAIVIAVFPMRVCHDRLPADLIKGNLLGGMLGRRSNDDSTFEFLRVGSNPLQGLHASHRTACHGKELIDPQMVYQALLDLDHIGNADDWKIQTIFFPGLGIDGRGPGRSAAASKD